MQNMSNVLCVLATFVNCVNLVVQQPLKTIVKYSAFWPSVKVAKTHEISNNFGIQTRPRGLLGGHGGRAACLLEFFRLFDSLID